MDIMRMGKNPNYLGSWDLDDLPGRILTVTIKRIVDEEVVNGGKKEVCTACYFEEDYKPMILNITNKKTLCKLYKTKQTERLCGKKITIGVEKVKAFGDIYDALRIKPKVVENKSIACDGCGNNISPAYNMSSEELAAYTQNKFGRKLCAVCAKKESESKTE